MTTSLNFWQRLFIVLCALWSAFISFIFQDQLFTQNGYFFAVFLPLTVYVLGLGVAWARSGNVRFPILNLAMIVNFGLSIIYFIDPDPQIIALGAVSAIVGIGTEIYCRIKFGEFY